LFVDESKSPVAPRAIFQAVWTWLWRGLFFAAKLRLLSANVTYVLTIWKAVQISTSLTSLTEESRFLNDSCEKSGAVDLKLIYNMSGGQYASFWGIEKYMTHPAPLRKEAIRRGKQSIGQSGELSERWKGRGEKDPGVFHSDIIGCRAWMNKKSAAGGNGHQYSTNGNIY
jgi:hypothetical protein